LRGSRILFFQILQGQVVRVLELTLRAVIIFASGLGVILRDIIIGYMQSGHMLKVTVIL
jgi:hypothetical protein